MNSTMTPMRPGTPARLSASAEPWWRHPMVWLVLGGPAVVVVACLVTFWVAVSHPDPVVADSASTGTAGSLAEMPAQQARNQAAAASR